MNKMNFSNSILLFSGFVVTFLLLIEKSSALTCYECNSYNNSRCAEDNPPDEMKVECKNTAEHKYILCRKILQVIEFEVNGLPPDTRVIRSCGWDDSSYKNKCYQRSGFGGRQEVCACESDLCNDARSNIHITRYYFYLPLLTAVIAFSKFYQ